MPTAPGWPLLAAAAVIGAVVGSFLNVCVHRLLLGESVVRPGSHCPTCRSPIAWRDNIPVLGWVALRGRCRACRTPISVRYPLVELATALIWVAAAARSGFSAEAVRTAFFLTLLLGIALTDATERAIPDQFSLIGLAVGVAMAPLSGGIGLVPALIGAAGWYVFLWALKLAFEKMLGKAALGVGDIHLMAMVGAFAGLRGGLLTLLLGSLLGLLVGLPLNWWRGTLKALGTYLPLGTFLAVAAAVVYLWGDALFGWSLALSHGGI